MERDIIFVMIICATIIALVAIICDFFNNKRTQNSYENLLAQKIIKIHRNYIAGFLGFAVIALVSAKYGGPDNSIFDYLSFGSTITSLVLSVLAIFVTVQSSSDLYKQFTRIDNATETIKNVSGQIDKTLSTLEEAETNLQKASVGISNQLERIVERIDEKLQMRMRETENAISKQLEESMNKSSNNGNNQPVQSNSENWESFKKNFKTLTSSNGLLALYACSLSKENGKMFELSCIFKDSELYIFGYIIASLSSGIIFFTNDVTNNQITCTDIAFSSSELYEAIKDRIKQHGQDYLNRVNIVNNYFNVPELNMDLN